MAKNIEKLYDEMVTVAYVNLYTLSKNKHEIYLNGFDPLNDGHRALYAIASMVSSNYQFPINIGCKLFTYLKYRKLYKPYAFAKRKTFKDGLTCDEIINHIETAFVQPGVFKDIYAAYYKKGE